MKKLIIALVLLSLSSMAMAAHGPAGCGLGSVLFKGKDGMLFNILAATFNATSGNQTFGMSTGTLNCEDAGKATVSAVSFIEGNIVALSNDIAKGSGETLTTYLSLINKKGVDTSELQNNHDLIFVDDIAANIYDRINDYI